MGRPGFIAFFLLSVLLLGCSTPVPKEYEKVQIVEVTVTKADGIGGTANLAEAVRYKTQDAAYRFSEEGPETTLKIHITRYSPAEASQAILSGGETTILADVILTDKATGASREPFGAYAILRRQGGIVGAIQLASVNPIDEEQTITGRLAQAIMERIFGKDAAREAASRTPAKRAVANYPVSYAEASRKYTCDRIRKRIETEKFDQEIRGRRTGSPGPATELPPDC